MPASMLAAGIVGVRTPYSRAVAGISCISPIAPFATGPGLIGRLHLDDGADQPGVDAVGLGLAAMSIAVGR